jgi:hypothetical protein
MYSSKDYSMTIVGISFSTLVEIFFFGWIAGVLTVFALIALSSKWFKSKKKV